MFLFDIYYYCDSYDNYALIFLCYFNYNFYDDNNDYDLTFFYLFLFVIDLVGYFSGYLYIS